LRGLELCGSSRDAGATTWRQAAKLRPAVLDRVHALFPHQLLEQDNGVGELFHGRTKLPPFDNQQWRPAQLVSGIQLCAAPASREVSSTPALFRTGAIQSARKVFGPI
jgi:hypothetical protein